VIDNLILDYFFKLGQDLTFFLDLKSNLANNRTPILQQASSRNHSKVQNLESIPKSKHVLNFLFSDLISTILFYFIGNKKKYTCIYFLKTFLKNVPQWSKK